MQVTAPTELNGFNAAIGGKADIPFGRSLVRSIDPKQTSTASIEKFNSAPVVPSAPTS